MPYCRQAGLIFVAVPKTGSTSMIEALDIACRDVGGISLLRDEIDDDYRRRYRLDEIGDPQPGRAKHLSAIQLLYILGEEEFSRCASFAVVRNPWSRMVSRYFFKHRELEPSDEEKQRLDIRRGFHDLDFETWLHKVWRRYRNGKAGHLQLTKLVDGEGRLLVDHVGRLENIEDTLNWVQAHTDLPPLRLPHSNRASRGHYSQYYNDTTRDMVAEICQQDIAYFNYRYED